MSKKDRQSFEERRAHLAALSDDALYDYFWELTAKVVDPLLALGRDFTTPAIERSVLLRMGFSSLEAAPIVDGALSRGLIGKGCGHVVWKLSQALGVSIREAGTALARGEHWDEAERLFAGGAK
jgi:D-ornithine 4,5-aminomutase subunit alpha